MELALVSLDDYVVDKDLLNKSKDDFYEVEVRFVDSSEELENSDITYMNENEFINFYSTIIDRNNYGMLYSEHSEYKVVRVKFTKELGKTIFDTEHYLEEILRRHNERLTKNKHTKVKYVSIVLNNSEYDKWKSKLEEEKAKMKKAFLADMFSDSQLSDNAHNRLICEKAWVVTCNTEYYGDYMSVNFYSRVERWFSDLKELAI